VSDIEVSAGNTVTVETENNVTVETPNNTATVSTDSSGVVDVNPYEYSLTSSGIYTGNLTGGIPIWLQTAIEQELTEGEGNLTSVVADLASLVTVLEAGVNQNITNINTTNTNLAALETTVVSRLDGNDAAIVNLDVTKVTATEATAISADVVSTSFGGNVDAYIGTIAATYVDANSAIAQEVDTLVTSVNGVTASVSEVSVASVDEGEARAKHSLVVNADGNIAGYVAEAGTTSNFTIVADTFKVQGTTTGYTPIAVDTVTGKLKFTGDVRFEGLGIDGGSTTIDGGKITTNTLDANRLTTNFAWINGSVQSSDFTTVGGAGFRLKANAAGTSADPSIYGAYIRGGTISAVELESSTLNVRDITVTTDSGLPTRTVIASVTTPTVTSTSATWTFDIGHWSATTTTNRLAGPASILTPAGTPLINYTSFYSGSTPDTRPASMSYNGWPILYFDPDVATSTAFSITVNGVAWNAPTGITTTTPTINGITFAYIHSGVGDDDQIAVFIKPICSSPTTWSGDKLVITFSSASTWLQWDAGLRSHQITLLAHNV